MKAVFRQILERALFAREEPVGLLIIAESDPDALQRWPEQPGQLNSDVPYWAVGVPQELFPTQCDIRLLPGSESFIVELERILAREKPQHTFVLPPVIGLRYISEGLRRRFPAMDLEAMALQVALDILPAGSFLGTMLPKAFFSAESYRPFRERLIRAVKSCLFIVHDFSVQNLGFADIHPAFRMQTLILETGKAKPPMVRFFKLPEVDYTESTEKEILRDFKRLQTQGGGTTQYGYILPDEIPADSPWLYEALDPELQRQVRDMQHFGSVELLGDLVDLKKGLTITKYRSESDDTNLKSTVPVIEARDLHSEKSLVREDTRYRIADVPHESRLQEGDICLRSFDLRGSKLTAIKIEEEMLPLAAGRGVIILRPKDHSTLDVDFLVLYLRSDAAMRYLQAQGFSIQITIPVLRKLPVPVMDEMLSTALRHLRDAARRFEEWKVQADRAISSLFDISSAENARLHLLSTGRKVRQRQRAAEQVDEFDYRVRTRFPHPVAYRWRTVAAAKPDLEGYVHVLECAEVTACYLASVAILMARALDVNIGHINNIAKKLSQRNDATTFGDWVTILQEVRDSKALKKVSTLVPFYEVTRFLDDSEVYEALQKLQQKRNAQSHGKGPKGDSRISQEFYESRILLELLLKSVEFLSEYPLLYIELIRRDSLLQITKYSYRELMGDHPLVPISHDGEVDTSEIELNALYLVDRSGELYLLRPVLIHRECPVCGRWTTFHLDAYKQTDDLCILKGLQHGHTLTDSSISGAFRHIGLLLT
jgi:hypothetical protein